MFTLSTTISKNKNMPSPSEDSTLLLSAEKKIAYLKEVIQKLTDELQQKEALLAKCTDVASEQSRQLVALSAAAQDTVFWDPNSTCPRPSCSTPHVPWTEVEIRRQRSRIRTTWTNTAPGLEFSNRYEILARDPPADDCMAPVPLLMDDTVGPAVLQRPEIHLVATTENLRQSSKAEAKAACHAAPSGSPAPSDVPDCPAASDVPSRCSSPSGPSVSSDAPVRHASPSVPPASSDVQAHHPASPDLQEVTDASARPALPPRASPPHTNLRQCEGRRHPQPQSKAGSSPPASGRASAERQSRSQNFTRSARYKLLKQAVIRRSGSFPGPGLPEHSSPRSDTICRSQVSQPELCSQQLSPDCVPEAQLVRPPRMVTEGSRLAVPPLFSPTTLIIGDSIIRKIRFFDAVTHCFPGATVSTILTKLQELLDHSSCRIK